MRRLKQWTAALCAMVLLMSAVPAAGGLLASGAGP